MKQIDLNCDMGEGFGLYKLTDDEELIKYISSANVACGFHAGDPMVMRKAVALAKRQGVAVGAHPGLPDLMGGGRRYIKVEPAEIENYMIYQIGALKAFVEAEGMKLQHVKAHGPIYNYAMEDESWVKACVNAIVKIDPSVIYMVLGGEKGEMMVKVAQEAGLKVALEGFPDRAYLPKGTLVPRGQPGAVILNSDEVAERAVRMATEGKVKAIDGTVIDLDVETLCFHGDNPESIQALQKVQKGMKRVGVEVARLGTFL